MTVIIAVCVIVATIAAAAVAVYLIDALRQLKKSLQAIEELARHADETAVMVNSSARKVASLAEGVGNIWGKVVPMAMGVVWTIKNRFFSKNSADVGEKTAIKD